MAAYLELQEERKRSKSVRSGEAPVADPRTLTLDPRVAAALAARKKP